MTSTPVEGPVLVTGAAGALGREVVRVYRERGIPTRGLDVAQLDGVVAPDDSYVGSILDIELVRTAMRGARAVVHFGGIADPSRPWPDILSNNIDGTRTVLEAARLESVGRVMLASSNHAAGYERIDGQPLSADVAPRPDSTYGVSKAALEAFGAYYADAFGIRTTSVRIGSCLPEPNSERALATWLSYPDLLRVVDASLVGPWTGHRIVWGVSRNSRGWFDLTAGEEIGFFPEDDGELWADKVPAGDAGNSVGGMSLPIATR